jgi:hypothetical protein
VRVNTLVFPNVEDPSAANAAFDHDQSRVSRLDFDIAHAQGGRTTVTKRRVLYETLDKNITMADMLVA